METAVDTHGETDAIRRAFMKLAAFSLPMLAAHNRANGAENPKGTKVVSSIWGPLRQIRAGQLNVGYHELGPSHGEPVLLLHGFPYDIHSYVDVAPALAAEGCRVLVPHLRGHGSTTFLDAHEPRSGQQAAIGQDVVDFLDALKIKQALVAGYDWGGRAACVAAALWPERCTGLVSVNGYLIQDIAKAAAPLPAKVEHGLWYQHYFQTERGRAGLAAHRREIAEILWKNNSPGWWFDDETFQRSAAAFDNPDYVDVVIHSYRHRMGLADGYARYAAIEKALAMKPVIRVPAITLDGAEDGVIAATDGSASRVLFAQREHRIVEGAGHNLPQETPAAFTTAVMDIIRRDW